MRPGVQTKAIEQDAWTSQCAVSHRFPAAMPLFLPFETPNEGTLMSGWILLGFGVCGVIAKAIGWSYARAKRSDLGSVSRRWLAEQHF